jgi:mRNA interferase MazF
MKRGDIIVVRQSGTIASKARPCLVVQTDAALDSATHVTICPLTSTLRGAPLIRVPIEPDSANGLARASEIETDLIYTIGMANIGGVIGRVDMVTLRLVDEALRRWLDL